MLHYRHFQANNFARIKVNQEGITQSKELGWTTFGNLTREKVPKVMITNSCSISFKILDIHRKIPWVQVMKKKKINKIFGQRLRHYLWEGS